MKLKNKYGFTLIELLAVIVILAIIALIATSIVMNTIKKSKKGSAERSADSYIKQVEVLCTAKTTATTGNVPSGSYAYGDEYTCELGDNDAKTFFVLETNGDNVSLIMDRNIDSNGKGTTSGNEVVWCKSGSNNSCAADGALEYLKNSTTSWTKLTESQISLPTGQQIATAGGDSAWTDSNFTGTILSAWLYENLNDISAPYGYWTSTPNASYSSNAWNVHYDSILNSYYVDDDSYYGVRPVITVSKANLN